MRPAVFEETTLRLVAERNVVVAAWRDAPTVPQLRLVERVGRGVELRYPGQTALINLILSGTPRFSAEVRAEVGRMNNQDDLYVLAAAHVILVEGFLATAVRAFLSTTMLVVKPATPTKIFGDTTLAARWVAERLAASGERWTPEQLLALAKQA
ncbi:MAG: hypothetical protein MUF64_12330 [Polyangiaceae bacterium]|jgi:hypothetical protein|nr:hypothetical protein [Polyangiaceae bacterium]